MPFIDVNSRKIALVFYVRQLEQLDDDDDPNVFREIYWMDINIDQAYWMICA